MSGNDVLPTYQDHLMQQYLAKHFTIPDNIDKPLVCLRGHILHLYFYNRCSVTDTIVSVKEKFHFMPTVAEISQLGELADRFKFDSFTAISVGPEFASFCREKFLHFPPPTATVSRSEVEACVASAPGSQLLPISSAASPSEPPPEASQGVAQLLASAQPCPKVNRPPACDITSSRMHARRKKHKMYWAARLVHRLRKMIKENIEMMKVTEILTRLVAGLRRPVFAVRNGSRRRRMLRKPGGK